MSGDARREFLSSLMALRQSLDTPLVSGNDPVGSFLRRGLTIVSYNLLETFIADRMEEIATHMNSSIIHFSDLPEKLQRAATSDVLRYASFKVQRGGLDPAAILSFTTSVGESLAASSGSLRLSPLTWQWPGSNMGSDDIQRAMKLFHVAAPWQTMELLTIRIGSAMLDPRTIVNSLVRERNSCAHRSSHEVSNLLIRAIPNQLQVIGMCFDIVISVAAQEMYLGRREFLEDGNWMSPSRLRFRFVQQRPKQWAEIPEGAGKAVKVDADRDVIVKSAVSASIGKRQVVVIKDLTVQPIDWIYPELP